VYVLIFTTPACSVAGRRKKASGDSQNGRKSNPKYLGLKKGHGQAVVTGNIIMRQRGTKIHAKSGVGLGRDHTLFALLDGRVKFSREHWMGRTFVSVIPHERCKEAFPKLRFNPIPPVLSAPRRSLTPEERLAKKHAKKIKRSAKKPAISSGSSKKQTTTTSSSSKATSATAATAPVEKMPSL